MAIVRPDRLKFFSEAIMQLKVMSPLGNAVRIDWYYIWCAQCVQSHFLAVAFAGYCQFSHYCRYINLSQSPIRPCR